MEIDLVLEEAAIEYCGGNKGSDARVRTGFIMGAIWQQEKMMAKAVDGVVAFDYYGGGNDDKTYGYIAHNSFCIEDMGLKETNKVKLIIIKQE